MKRVLLVLVRVYRLALAPVHHALFGPCCRFEPTCSAYAEEALRAHGAGRGAWLAARRLLRCHPLGGSGFDPVPEPRNDDRRIETSGRVPNRLRGAF